MAWIALVVAGVLETGWALGLKSTDGFTRPIPSILTAGGIALSMVLLAYAAKTIPIGTAYVVWVGIGAAGTAILGIVFLGEPASVARVGFLALLIAGVIGLKFTSS